MVVLQELKKCWVLSGFERNCDYMRESLFISIIIPAYNVESTIGTLIVNLEMQRFPSFEIIVINDGSTDHTQEVISRLSKKYDNITSISQVNMGVSSARNTGLKSARGQYVLFLDADDNVSNQLLSVVYQKAKHGNFQDELIIFGKENIDSNGKVVSVNKIPEMESQKLTANMFTLLLDNNLLATMYNKVAKRTLIGDNLFQKLSVGEDFQFVLDILEKGPMTSFINKSLYTYELESVGSIMQKYNPDRLTNFVNQKAQMKRIISDISSSKAEELEILSDLNIDTLDRIATNIFRKQSDKSLIDQYTELSNANNEFNTSTPKIIKKYQGVKRVKMFLVVRHNILSFLILSILYKIR